MKSAVATALTERVQVPVAVAPSAWLTKTAAEANKPSAPVVWRPSDRPRVYAALELEDLPDAGPRICKRLRSTGIGTVRGLHDAERSRAIVACGSIEGERVRLALRGHDLPAPTRVRAGVAYGRVLGRSGCWRRSRPVVRWLAVCALRRCVEGRQVPRRVRVEVVTRAGDVRSGAALIAATGHERELLREVSAIWNAATDTGPFDLPVRVGLVLDRLAPADAPLLFAADRREHRLQALLDVVRERYAAPALVWGRCADPDASRLRAVLDGSRTFALAGDATLMPWVVLGIRHDGGDAETGRGFELGAGLSYADPSRGLDMTLRAYALAAHAEDGYSDWGVSGSLRLVPGGSGRGFSATLTPSWGVDPGGSERLWLLPDALALAANDDAPLPNRRDGEVGHGLPVFGGGFTGTPNVGFGLSDTAREVRIGWRLSPARGGGFEVSLDLTRRDAANDDDTGSVAEHAVGVRLNARF